MEHILLECTAVGQERVWALAEAAWSRTGHTWTPIVLPDILAIGPRSRALAGDAPTPKPRARLWRILVSESAHLVWRLRCERVIGQAGVPGWQHSADGVTARWLAAIQVRLRHDVEGTRKKYGRLALKRNLVLQTWDSLVACKDGRGGNLPADWTKLHRVLVGIDPTLATQPGPGDPRVPH